MYKKLIKRGSKTYSYYYHNYRKGSQVKNFFLGNNLKQAKLNLNKFNSLNQAPIPNRQSSGSRDDKNPGYSGAILIALFLLALGIGFFFFKPEITGLVTDESVIQQPTIIIEPEQPVQETLKEESQIQQPIIEQPKEEQQTPKQEETGEPIIQQPQVIEESKPEVLTHDSAEINKPVTWTKEVKLARVSSNYQLILPKEAYNLNINKQDNNKEVKVSNIIVPLTTLSDSSNQTIIINELVQNLTIIYQAPGPRLIESKSGNGIKVQISSNLPYTNVLAYVNYNLSGNIRLIHENLNNLDVTNDINYNVSITQNKVTWVVPHLSVQYFFITNDTTNLPPTSTIKFGKWSNGTFLNTTGKLTPYSTYTENLTLNRTGTYENAGSWSAGVGTDTGVAFDSSDNTIWVVLNPTTINHFSVSGADLTGDITVGSGASDVFELDYDARDDSLWVSDDTDNAVYHFNAADGSNLTGGFVTGPAGNTEMRAITLDTSDNTFWTGDYTDGFLYHYNSAGTNQSDGIKLFSFNAAPAPFGVKYDDRDDTLWVTDSTDDFIYHVNASNGANLGDGFNIGTLANALVTYGVTIDNNYTIYGVDDEDNVVYKYLDPYSIQGNYTSEIFDSGISSSAWNNLTWNTINSTGNDINISVRSCDDAACSGESFTFLARNTSQNYNLNSSITPSNRWFQFLIDFRTTNNKTTPQLLNVNITSSNTAPTVPTNLQPTNYSILTNFAPNLNWTNSTDVEGDTLTYNLQISTDPSFSAIVYSATAIPTGPSPTGHNVTTTLNTTRYWWRVRADDTLQNGTYSYGMMRLWNFSNDYIDVTKNNGSFDWLNGTFVNTTTSAANGENLTLSQTGWDNKTNGFSAVSAGVNSIFGITFDSSDNTLWIADFGDFFIYHFNLAGVNQSDGFRVVDAGVANEANNGPNAVTYDSRNDTLWATESTDDFIYHFNASNGNNLTGGFPTASAGNDDPQGIAFNPTDNSFWVLSNTDDFVYHFSATGVNQSNGFSATPLGSDAPLGITYDTRDSTLWISDSTDDFVYHVDTLGNNLSDGFGTLAAGSTLSYGVAFDTSNNSFWVADGEDNFVHHFLNFYYFYGNYTSEIFDVKSSQGWENITLNATNSSVTSFNLSVRSCDDAACAGENFNFVAMNRSGNFTLNTSITPANRYFQFKLELGTSDNTTTSTFFNVNTSYSSAPRINQTIIITNGTLVKNTRLNGSAGAFDPDLSKINITFRWYRNNVEQLAFTGLALNWNNGDLVYSPFNVTNASKNEVWILGANASDGLESSAQINSSSVTIGNIPPLKANITSPTNNTIISDLTPSFNYTNGTDIDGDQLNITVWISTTNTFSNIVNVFNITQSQDTKANTSISLNRTTYFVNSTSYDGTSYSANELSNFTVNQIPSINQSIIIHNGTLVKNTQLNGSAGVFDNDTNQRFNITFRWYRNNAEQLAFTGLALNLANGSLAYSPFNVSNATQDEVWILGANASDGLESSTQINSTAITIINVIPTQSTPNIGSHLDINDSGMVAYYTFENNATDISLNDNNGILDGVNYTLAGRVGGAYKFDGVDDFVNVTTSISAFDGTSATYTISFWIKRAGNGSSGNGNQMLFGYGDDNSLQPNDDIYMYWSTNNSRMRCAVGGGTESNCNITDLTDGAFHHIALVKNTSHFNIYENGILNNFTAQSGVASDANSYLSIAYSFSPGTFFNGTIDEFAIYNRTLSAQEIYEAFSFGNTTRNRDLGASINNTADSDGDNISIAYTWYNNSVPFAKTVHNETNLVAYFPLDNDALDYAGNNNVTLGNQTANTSPNLNKSANGFKIGTGAYSFDGVDDWINISTISGYSGGDNDITIMSWFYGNNGVLVGAWGDAFFAVGTFNSGAAGKDHFFLRLIKHSATQVNGCDASNWRVAISADNGTNDRWWCSNTVVNLNEWHYAAASYNSSSDRVRLYVDGAFDREVNLSAAMNIGIAAYIGRDVSPSTEFSGFIDDSAIYNKVLTDEEIRQHYLAGANFPNLNQTHLKKGDNWTIGTTVFDSTSWDGESNSSFINITNKAPSIPTLNSPANDTITSDLTPELAINNASDVDNDAITYNIEIATSSAFSTIVHRITSIAEGTTPTKANTTVSLNRTSYYWRANSSDGLESSGYSDIRNFTVNTVPSINQTIIITNGTLVKNTRLNGSAGVFDNDTNQRFNITFRWYRNNAEQYNFTGLALNLANGSLAYATINVTNTSKDEVWILGANASDGLESSAQINSSSVTIGNIPPLKANITSPTNNTIISDLTPSFNYTNGTDIDGDQLNITVWISTTNTFSNIVNVFNITQSQDTKANTSISLNRTTYFVNSTSYDGTSYSANELSNFTINSLPTFANTISNTNTNEDTAFTVDFTSNITDSNGHDINLTWQNNDTSKATITIDNSTDDVTITPVANQTEIISINLTLFDGLETGTKINWNITINAVNDPPYWTGSPANDNTNEETEDSVILSSFIADVDDSDTVLGISYKINDTNKATIAINNATKNLSINPLANQTGLFRINLTIFDDDGVGSSDIKQINWTINNINDPPVIDPGIGNRNTNEDTVFTLNLTQFATDIDSTEFNWSWSLNLSSLVTASIDNSTDVITLTPAANATGIILVGLTLYDNESLSDSETINFTVNAVNDPPYWVSNPANQVTDEETTGVYDISSIVADIDDVASALSLAWQNNETGKATITIDNSTKIITFTTIANQTGRSLVNLTIYDDDSLASPKKTINWDISNINDPPVINPDIGDNQTNEDTSFTLNLTVYETDVDSVDFNWSWSLNGSSLIVPTINNATRILTVAPAANQTGSVKLQLTLHDNVSSTDMQNITFHVIGVNDPPYISPLIANNASLTNNTFTYSLAPHDNDVDGTDFNWSYRANSSIITLSINNNTDSLSIVTTNTTGVVSINLTVYDNESATYAQNFNFTIAYHPSFISMFSYPTYITVNRTQTANITIRLNQSTNASFTNLTITDPNGINVNLTSTNTTVIGSTIYEYNFTFTPKAVGTYKLRFTLNDTVFPTTNAIQRNFTFYSVNSESVNFTGSNTQRITIKDVENKEVLYSGSNITLTTFPPGYYQVDIHSSDNEFFAEFANATINATINATFNYTDIQDTLALPTTGVSNINQFAFNSSVPYNNVTITYNYVNNLSNITFESRLRLYKCASESSCSWSFINATVNSNQDNITINLTNLSVFNIVEQALDTVTTTVSSGGGGGGGTSIQETDITILQPEPISLFGNETITTPIIIRNNGEKILSGITLKVETDKSELAASLSKTSIATLNAGSEDKVDLTITNSGLPLGQYEIVVTANVANPLLVDQGKFYVDIIERFYTEKTKVKEQINYLKELFNLNPECLELNELLDQVQTKVDEEEFDEALKLANSAVDSCKKLVESHGKELTLPKKTDEITSILILAGEVTAFLFIVMIVYNYYKKKKRIERFKKRY